MNSQPVHVSCLLGFESFFDRFPSIVLLLMLIWADTVCTLVCCTGRGTNPVSWWITCSSGSVCQSWLYVHFIHIFNVAKTPLSRQVFVVSTIDKSYMRPQCSDPVRNTLRSFVAQGALQSGWRCNQRCLRPCSRCIWQCASGFDFPHFAGGVPCLQLGYKTYIFHHNCLTWR